MKLFTTYVFQFIKNIFLIGLSGYIMQSDYLDKHLYGVLCVVIMIYFLKAISESRVTINNLFILDDEKWAYYKDNPKYDDGLSHYYSRKLVGIKFNWVFDFTARIYLALTIAGVGEVFLGCALALAVTVLYVHIFKWVDMYY